MAADITEEFQVDLSSVAGAAAVSLNSDVMYDYGFNGLKFFDASSPDNKYIRQTAQYQKNQNDNSSDPGEQSFIGWWLRSQSSFHYGAGINFFEPAAESGVITQNRTIPFRFSDSQGVNVWEAGDVTLLRDVTAGHAVTGSGKTGLRPIKWSGNNGVLMIDNYDVDKIDTNGTETHFVDYSSGTADPVLSICDDGVYAYWVNNVGTTKKWTVSKKVLTATASDAATQVYQHASATFSSAVLEYVKERLILCGDNKIYELTVGGTLTDLFTAPSSDAYYTGITASPSDIYVSMNQGMRSVILKLTFSANAVNTIGVLGGAVTVAEMPRGELIQSIQYYLGYLLIGTSKGVRVAEVQANGGIVYGPLLFESSQPVYGFACNDHYAWAAAGVAGDTGLVRIDLANQIDSLVFPYANDLQAVGVQRTTTGVAFCGDSDRLAFTAAASGTNGAVYVENASTLRSSGWIRTGKIRFNTVENKFFKYVKERATYSGGSISITAGNTDITTVYAGNGNTDVGITEVAPVAFKQFKFTLNRDTTNTSIGPTLHGYQIKALPAIRRQRMIQFPLWCFDRERDRFGTEIGYEGRAYQNIAVFEEMEAQSDIISVVDYRTGESFQAMVEECSFVSTSAPSSKFSGFGGILTVTVRKL